MRPTSITINLTELGDPSLKKLHRTILDITLPNLHRDTTHLERALNTIEDELTRRHTTAEELAENLTTTKAQA